MAATQQELQAAITALVQAIADDKTQDQKVITIIETLIAKIQASPAAPDFTQEITALSEAITSLGTSNAAVQTELDKTTSI